MPSAFCHQNRIALSGENRACKLANGWVILDKEDGFRSPAMDGLLGLDRRCGDGFLDAREINFEGGALARLTVNPNVTAALLDDAVDSGESQAGAAAASLSGVERLENVRLRIGVHADAGVGDGEHDIRTGLDENEITRVVSVEVGVCGVHRER